MPDYQSTVFLDGNLCRVPNAFDEERDRLIAAIDSHSETKGAGIILIRENGNKVEVRGGPRRRWIWIAPKGKIVEQKSDSITESPPPSGFWDRWGDSTLSCGSAVATGAVIYLSGGTASFLVGAFAVNSALLCGSSLGKAIANETWKEFEDSGGTAYKLWLTTETMLELVDLFNGVKGAVKFLKSLKTAGKLAKLEKAVRNSNLTRAQLKRIIQQIDPVEGSKIMLKAKGASYVSKGKLFGVGENLLKDAQFISLSNQRIRVITNGIGDALTLEGARKKIAGFGATPEKSPHQKFPYNIEKKWDIWFVQYSSEGRPQ